ncbi:MAG: DUF1015 domain-containing protein [Verrucomicrobiae bacterium]|nr:DUF1015 domain-containing protein [Verrucomicrobiae bacterium]
MAEIQPLRGVLYDSNRVRPQEVLTQPYDKITPAMQAAYEQRSPYNLIRIELGRDLPGDDGAQNKYTRAASLYQQWLTEGILRRTAQPALYWLEQRFAPPGQTGTLTRHALIARVRLHRWEEGVILPHEHTLAKPKADRLALLRATRSQQGPIFMLYPNSLPAPAVGEPLFDFVDDFNVATRMWEITEPAVIASIQRALQPQTLYVADGHHRYETALAYRDEAGTEASRYVMAALVDMNDPGLIILPTHRAVGNLTGFDAGKFLHRLAMHFAVDACADLPATLTAMQSREHAIGMFVGGRFAVLTPRDVRAFAPLFQTKPALWDQLDVGLLHVAILEALLGIDEARLRDETHVTYWREPELACNEVQAGRAQLAFFLKPTPIRAVQAVADARSRMPQKSTDFYPKFLSGLVIYELQ